MSLGLYMRYGTGNPGDSHFELLQRDVVLEAVVRFGINAETDRFADCLAHGTEPLPPRPLYARERREGWRWVREGDRWVIALVDRQWRALVPCAKQLLAWDR